MAEKFIDHDLIARIERFIAATPNMSPSTFGRQVANDSDLLKDLKEGRELRRSTLGKIETFIAAGQPDQKGALTLQPQTSTADSSAPNACSSNSSRNDEAGASEAA